MFSVGDLVDRGPAPEAALEWIIPIRGNHEQTMINALTLEGGRRMKSGYSDRWAHMGGGWWWDFPDINEHAEAQRCESEIDQWLTALRQVPYVRTIETAGKSSGSSTRQTSTTATGPSCAAAYPTSPRASQRTEGSSAPAAPIHRARSCGETEPSNDSTAQLTIYPQR